MEKKTDTQKKIPTGKISRFGVIGVATAKAGLKKVGYLSQKPFRSDEKNRKQRVRNDESIAKTIFGALSKLKGAPLKLAQMISMDLELLPNAYQKELSKSASEVPPMNRALIRKVLITELGAPPETVFKAFEATPFAAASLGQVHRATTFDGKELAVKVQYPGIAKGVTTDLEMLKVLVKATPYARIFNGAIKEIEERIIEELDYQKEVQNTIWFHNNLKMNSVIVPEVVEEFCSKYVITTSRIAGLHLNEWLATNPSAELKNHYGQLLCDLFSKSVYHHKLIHADPNIGNFLFRDDGKLGLIDFGCVKSLDDVFISNMKALAGALDHHDFSKLKQSYEALGVHYKNNTNDKDFVEFISKWIEWVLRPRRSEVFDFGKNANYFSEGKRLLPKIYGYLDHYDNGSLLYYGRAEYGLYRILQRLNASVTMKLL